MLPVGQIIRVFPRRTKATPDDGMVFIGEVPLWRPTVKEVHISCTFTWDKPECERLADNWEQAGYDVLIGGPAYDALGEDFIPGRYLKKGYVVTSRGCNNRCWFCSAWRREGKLRELPITEGWILQDNNLLQCSESHIRQVFAMLKKQNHPVEFSGGLESQKLKDWHVDWLAELKPRQVFFAYDCGDDYAPLVVAGRKLQYVGFDMKGRVLRCYVLIGYRGDSFREAEWRLIRTMKAGFWPMAMLWCGEDRNVNPEWRKFQRQWARMALMYRKYKEYIHS